jgi:hypothetical protein
VAEVNSDVSNTSHMPWQCRLPKSPRAIGYMKSILKDNGEFRQTYGSSASSVDFLGADVSRKEREAVGGEAAPLSDHVVKGQGYALQREKPFRPSRANLDATKRRVGPAFVEVKIAAIPRPGGKTDDGVLRDRP